eukprot:TRINITY_DN51695_c0_g1_i1.p3 TRINITY_DN51695_c0_g1~~TRINITY_DN51695_c0_g1_i1.p3  ORF type:complete len:173 (+),score=21.72 TRINITY_DN51695_c0_g1_i1:1-519(+)
MGIYPVLSGPQNLFRALVQGHHILCGYQPMPDSEEFQLAQEMRYKVLDLMVEDSDTWRYRVHGEDFEQYIQRMRDPDTQPTELEISAATEVLKRAIRVYEPFDNDQQLCSTTFGEQYEPKQELELYGQGNRKFLEQNDILRLFCRQGHYDLLITVTEDTYQEAVQLHETEGK